MLTAERAETLGSIRSYLADPLSILEVDERKNYR